MKGNSRAQRCAIHFDPRLLGDFHESRGAWYESDREIEMAFKWGERKAGLLAWVRRQMGRRLTRREQRCIELYYLEGLTFIQVGVRERCSASTACRSAARAVKKLRAAAQEDDSWRRFARRR